MERFSCQLNISGWVIVSTALVLTILGVGVHCQGAGPVSKESKKNWPRFRGPGGRGVSFYSNIPTSWNGKTGEGVLWKTAIPLPGMNSPVVWGDRVFLTGANKERRQVYCIDAKSGDILWQRAVENVPFSKPASSDISDDTGYAASTAATDGQRVCAIFANGDVVCFDFDGKQIWSRSVGPLSNMYGHASSLVIHRNLLLIQLDQARTEDKLSKLIAIETTSGTTVWEKQRPVPDSWATPIVINTGEREEIITCGNPWVIAYEPTTGKELWWVKCLGGDVAPSPVYADGLAFAINAYELLIAIRPGGQGDVTEMNIVWAAEGVLPDICSPLTNGELVFVLETEGLITCYDAKKGEKNWEKDLAKTFMASPSLVGDKVYLMAEDGVMIIIKATRKFEEIRRCELGENSMASPAFLNGRIYIRGKDNLYCIE
jgi:outer membrane protein assembly factor BamB